MGDTPFLTRCQEAAGGTEARVSRELTRQTPWLLLHLGADSSRVGKPGPSPFPVPRLSNYIFLNLTRTLTHCPTGGSPMPLPWVYVCMNAHAPCRHSGYGRGPVNPLAGQSPSPARISAAWRPPVLRACGGIAWPPLAAACRCQTPISHKPFHDSMHRGRLSLPAGMHAGLVGYDGAVVCGNLGGGWVCGTLLGIDEGNRFVNQGWCMRLREVILAGNAGG